MKHIPYKLVYSSLAFFWITTCYSQVLLEDRTADPLFNPIMSLTESKGKRDAGLIKVNVTDQSIGGIYFHKFKNDATKDNKYNFITLGLKAKPTEGYASVFKNNQFSPGTVISLSANRFKLFDKNDTKTDEGSGSEDNGFTDWGGIYANVPFNKYQLYRQDTTFGNQLYSKVSGGFEFGFSYNALFSYNIFLGAKGGYSRENNFYDLPEVEVSDLKMSYDTVTKTTRQVGDSKTARMGKFIEYDSYNLKLSLIHLTADGNDGNSFAVGYGAFLNVKSPAIKAPTTDFGFLLYLAQTKNSVSAPVLVFTVQFNDVSDNLRANNGLQKRIQFGLTTTIPLNNQ